MYPVLAEQLELKRKFQTMHILKNKGKGIQEVDEGQARIKLSDIRLYFFYSFQILSVHWSKCQFGSNMLTDLFSKGMTQFYFFISLNVV